MDPGDLCRANVSYVENGITLTKRRHVLIVDDDHANLNFVTVVESRGAPHPALSLIGVVNFEKIPYSELANPPTGLSHFYVQNITIMRRSWLDSRPFGALSQDDFDAFFDIIDKELINGLVPRPPP